MLQMMEQAARLLPGALSVHSQGYAHKAKPMCRLPALLDSTPRGGITGSPCGSLARPASPLRGVVRAGCVGREDGGARVLPPRLGGAQGTVVTGLLPSRGTSRPLGVWTASPSVLELRAKVLRDRV